MLAGRDGQSFTIGVFEEFSTPDFFSYLYNFGKLRMFQRIESVAVYSKWMTMYNGSDLRPGPYFVQQGVLAK